MSKFIDFNTGSYQQSGDFSLRFTDAKDICFPFDGTLIFSGDSSDHGLENIGVYHWLFLSFLSHSHNAGGKKIFRGLRDINNRPFGFNPGTSLIFVSNDPVYNWEQNCLKVSSRPKVLVIELDGIALSGDIKPTTRKEGASLKEICDGNNALNSIKDVLQNGTCSGNIHAFDLSGMRADAYSSLVNSEVDMSGALGDYTNVFIQFVDTHGSPMDINDKITWTKPSDYNVELKGGTPFFRTALQTPAQKLVFSVTDDKFKPFYRFSVWPEGDFLPCSDPGLGYDLNNGAFAAGSKLPVFLRICVFCALNDFQTQVPSGYDVNNPTLQFSKNSLYLFTENNHVKIFNTGDKFFKEFGEEVDSLQTNDKLYVLNWSCNPHIHMKGSLDFYEIAGMEDTADTVLANLDNMLAMSFSVRIDTDPVSETEYRVLITSVESGISGMVKAETDESEDYTGFLKGGRNTFFKLKNADEEVNTIRIIWKTDFGAVRTCHRDMALMAQANTTLMAFNKDWYSLGINSNDPPQAVLTRDVTASDIGSAVGAASLDNVRLLVLNVTANTVHVFSLAEQSVTLAKMSGSDTLAVAIIQDAFTDPLAEPELTTLTEINFLTAFLEYSYSDEENKIAAVPYREQELGGLYRKAINKKVDVRGMFWEQFLERIGDNMAPGNSTNEAITNIINKSIDGKFGGAVIDRSTRALGSFHQKASVLVRKDGGLNRYSAYVGGMDLTSGRWDTEYHYTYDPERINGKWHDVHSRIEGNAVSDMLRNFKQRWETAKKLKDIPNSTSGPRIYNSKLDQSISDIALTDLTKIKDPDENNAFIQINRTVPPKSSHAEIPGGSYVDYNTGELGALQSYLKAIESARKFIHIEDQYFFCTEVALALHEALAKEDGPEFLVLVLPEKLGENPVADKLLYKRREMAVNVLRYGASSPACEAKDSCCGVFPKNQEEADIDVSSKIAILCPVNDEGKDIYVHSKHIIVDDTWMSIGSSNIGYRSMTFDFEINAAMVGMEMYKGGTVLVRQQRLDLWRLLLRLPKSIEHILQDPYAGFRLFKYIEEQDLVNVSNRGISPFTHTWVKKLNASVMPDLSGEPEDSTVIDLAPGDEMYCPLLCGFLDPDGRYAPENKYYSNFVKFPSMKFFKISVTLNLLTADNITALTALLNSGAELFISMELIMIGTEESDPMRMASLSVNASVNAVAPPAYALIPFEGPCRIQARLTCKMSADAEETYPGFSASMEYPTFPEMEGPIVSRTFDIAAE